MTCYLLSRPTIPEPQERKTLFSVEKKHLGFFLQDGVSLVELNIDLSKIKIKYIDKIFVKAPSSQNFENTSFDKFFIPVFYNLRAKKLVPQLHLTVTPLFLSLIPGWSICNQSRLEKLQIFFFSA